MQTSIESDALVAILGEEAVRAADDRDVIDCIAPKLVLTPTTVEQIAQIMTWASASGAHIVPRGHASKISWGNPPTNVDIILETGRLQRVIEHAAGDMTATVEAGCTIADFQQTLAQQQQFLAVDPLWAGRATIGGVIASNDTGSLRLRYGGLRDQLIGLKVVLPDGTIARSGGKVVKNVAGYDLQKLMTGAFGTLGIIVEATFRLYPHAVATAQLSLAYESPAEAQKAMLAILDSTLVPAGMQMVTGGEQMTRLDIRFEGLPEGIEAQLEKVESLTRRTRQYGDDLIWLARERLWELRSDAVSCIAKLSLLPSDSAACCEYIARLAKPLRLYWSAVLQATGLGMVALSGSNEQVLLTALMSLRSFLAEREGHLQILECPTAIKAQLDVWGDLGDSIGLMRRVKERFDPQCILNPGRFVGRI